MKTLFAILLLAGAAFGQGLNSNTLTVRFAGVPSGPGSVFMLGVNNATNDEYNYGTDGAWHKIGGGTPSTCTDCVLKTPSADQTITGAHALILSNAASSFYVGAASPFSLNTGQIFFGPAESGLPAGMQDNIGFLGTGNYTAEITDTNAGDNAALNILSVTNGVVTIVQGDNVSAGQFNAMGTGSGETEGVDIQVRGNGAGNTGTLRGLNIGAPAPLNGAAPSAIQGLHIDNMSVASTDSTALQIDNQGAANRAISVSGGFNDLGPQATTVGSLATNTKCAAAGSAASPSAVACAAAPAGSFSCATNASTATCVVATTAVTAASAILVQPDSSLSSLLSVTCNTTADSGLTAPRISSRSAGVSFTIALGTFATNPVCYNYWIVN